MEKFSDFVEKLFLWLLKAIYYIMKVSFGVVMGSIVGLLLFFLFDDEKLSIIVLSIFAFAGLIAGIIYAERARKSTESPYFNKKNL